MWLTLLACVPDYPAPDLTGVAGDVQRGAYLANHVAVCISCHSDRDWSLLYAPDTTGAVAAGSAATQKVEAFPDGTVLWTRNLTPTALGGWTDGEIARAISSGLSKDGTPLFLNMPYDQFRELSRGDLASLVAYLRTLPPQPDRVPERRLPFPLGIVVRTMPMEPALVDAPPPSGTAAYGEYLAKMASCVWCHSPVDANSTVIAGRELSGGHRFPVPAPGGGVVQSANLTPDPDTGIGRWTREQFIARFKSVDPTARVAVAPGGFNTPMPWLAFSGMSDEDLGAIYDWLRTRPAASNAVVKYTPLTHRSRPRGRSWPNSSSGPPPTRIVSATPSKDSPPK